MHLIIRKASVRWVAGPHGGARAVTTDGGALTGAPFTSGHVRRRNFDTNPAELIAAAHAGSFSLALANELGKATLRTGEILVSTSVTLERAGVGWTIKDVRLNVAARLPGLSQGEFIDATMRAKTNCLVSRALRPTVSMNAKLENVAPGGRAAVRRPAGRNAAPRRIAAAVRGSGRAGRLRRARARSVTHG